MIFKMFLLFMCLICIYAYSNSNAKGIHHDEICGGFNGRRLYLELGEHGTLLATGTSKTGESQLKEYNQCTLEIVTCSSCIISIQFSLLNITNICRRAFYRSNSNCECNYIWIYDSSYEDVSGKKFCGNFIESRNSSLDYKSKTRSTTVKFSFREPFEKAFVLKYFSESNRQFIDTYPKSRDNTEKFLTSPFFPKNYPKDLSVEYVLNCKTVAICKIKLIFTDFQISRSSLIEFFDWNGQRIFVTTGSIFRPPILVSNGPMMVIRFYANGGSSIGFKLKHSYILGEDNNSTTKTYTDCGGLVDNLGGAITMMEMSHDGAKVFNCFWLIKPPQGYLHIKTHLYAKVTEFKNFAGNTQLILKEGLTSEGFLLANITYPNKIKVKEYVVSISEGIYISLSGVFDLDTKLEIVYSAFSYRDCGFSSDFLCRNARCISTTLQCDGFDNCGDLSDEPKSCATEIKGMFTHTPNFYFPKNERGFDLKTATIVFIISSVALMCLIISLLVLLYRVNMKGNSRRRLQTHLQSINDLLEEGSRVEGVEIAVADEPPPTYEAPPDYADVIKTVDNNHPISKKRHQQGPTKRKYVNKLLLTKNDTDSASLSTSGSTSNLLANNINIRNAPVQTIPTISIAAVENLPVHIDVSNHDLENVNDRKRSEELRQFSDKNRKFEFSPIALNNLERIGFFANLRSTNRQHCLSDSDLSSVMDETSNNRPSKLVRSASTKRMPINRLN